ncbi:MAG: hypothetical protein HOJ90_02740 [Alphaproteobacteria bacterium]|jgi:hypothetical protein|nr:hypothetical protein [Alphaproteobacteria bacterium]
MKPFQIFAVAATAVALLATPVLADGHKGASGKADKAMEKSEHGMKGKENAMERGEGKKKGLHKQMDGDDKMKMKKDKMMKDK